MKNVSPLNGPNSKTTCQNPTNTGTFLKENEKSFRTSPNLTYLGVSVGWKSRFKVGKVSKKLRLILLIFEKKVSLKGLTSVNLFYRFQCAHLNGGVCDAYILAPVTNKIQIMLHFVTLLMVSVIVEVDFKV